MRVAVSNAKGQLTELIHRAEAGEEIVLTRHGRAVVRLVPVDAAVAQHARSCWKRYGHLGPPGHAPEKLPPEARSSCLGRMVCPDDRRRYVGDDFFKTDLEGAL